MYGTIFRMKVKTGREDDLVRVFKDWESERKGKIKGAIGGLLMKPDNRSGEMIGVAIFEDRESYAANADDPEQHAWFMKMRDLLESDPEWEDGEYVAGSLS